MNQSLIDWDSLEDRLGYPIDHLPDKEVFRRIEKKEKQYRQEVNTHSYTQAMGWAGIFNSFGSKTSKKLTALDFLPYPDELKPSHRISPKTATLLLEAINSGKVSPKHIGLLSGVIDEAIELSKKGH